MAGMATDTDLFEHEPGFKPVEPPPPPPSRGPWIAGLLIAIALGSFTLIRWFTLDTRPLAWDQAIHTENSFAYAERLASGTFLDAMRPVYFNYPPLYNLSMLPMLSRTADIADAGAATNIFYLALLVWGCYLIGAFLLDRGAGFAAAALVSAYPIFVTLARQTLIDVSLTAWVTLAFYALLRSDSF